MSTVTLPAWFWIIYYLFLLSTLGTVVFSFIRKRLVGLSIIALFLVLTVPIVSLLNSIGREEGLNEMEYLFVQLQQGTIWSIYAFIGYLFLLVWWLLFLFKNKIKYVKEASTSS